MVKVKKLMITVSQRSKLKKKTEAHALTVKERVKRRISLTNRRSKDQSVINSTRISSRNLFVHWSLACWLFTNAGGLKHYFRSMGPHVLHVPSPPQMTISIILLFLLLLFSLSLISQSFAAQEIWCWDCNPCMSECLLTSFWNFVYPILPNKTQKPLRTHNFGWLFHPVTSIITRWTYKG